jgi:PAS domain S-box-containing protein
MTQSILITTTELNSPGPYIIYINKAFEELTGWGREEIIGKNPRFLQGPKTNLESTPESEDHQKMEDFG